MLAYAMASHTFDVVAVAFGGLLIGGALISRLAERTALSPVAVFVVVGFVLGRGGLGVINLQRDSGLVTDLATVALIVILLRDGLEVDGELLRSHWHLPVRKLAAAMPVTAALVAVAVKLLIGLSWTESFLVGVLLAPTDPVLSSSVVTNPRVPLVVRNSLNLESGLNDGLALPAVLALTAVLSPHAHLVLWQFICEDLGFGFGVGLAVGFAASLAPTQRLALEQQSLFALGAAFVAYGAAVLLPNGNGLIAVFVAAIVLGIRRPDACEAFVHQSVDIVEIVKLGVFAVFGSLLTFDGLWLEGWAGFGVAILTFVVARPVAVMGSLVRTATDIPTRAFMAWFGPKGVATMTFSLLISAANLPHGQTIFELVALTVVMSVFIHGASDRPGSEWMAKHAARANPGADLSATETGAPS